MVVSVGMLACLYGCPWPSGDLEGTWTNELDGGQLSFRGDTIDWYGDRGSFTSGQREWCLFFPPRSQIFFCGKTGQRSGGGLRPAQGLAHGEGHEVAPAQHRL